MPKGKRWEPHEIRMLRTNMSAREIADRTGRTLYAVHRKRCALGISISEGIIAPERLSPIEKVNRLYKLASDIGVRIK